MNLACPSNRKERPISLGIFPLTAGDALLTPEAQREVAETPAAEHWKFHELSQPRSHTSLKVSAAWLPCVAGKTAITDGRSLGGCKKPKSFQIERGEVDP